MLDSGVCMIRTIIYACMYMCRERYNYIYPSVHVLYMHTFEWSTNSWLKVCMQLYLAMHTQYMNVGVLYVLYAYARVWCMYKSCIHESIMIKCVPVARINCTHTHNDTFVLHSIHARLDRYPYIYIYLCTNTHTQWYICTALDSCVFMHACFCLCTFVYGYVQMYSAVFHACL
jgi:hypothetical protein